METKTFEVSGYKDENSKIVVRVSSIRRALDYERQKENGTFDGGKIIQFPTKYIKPEEEIITKEEIFDDGIDIVWDEKTIFDTIIKEIFLKLKILVKNESTVVSIRNGKGVRK